MSYPTGHARPAPTRRGRRPRGGRTDPHAGPGEARGKRPEVDCGAHELTFQGLVLGIEAVAGAGVWVCWQIRMP
ncbi:hypothetical protein GCM10009864_79300 [Streptomyces lunalinharesii]|uniref:Uncharacterized protein n=1 Tax=Streptomyces lunalinharesii TaxID=333384 RepID=A0ABP6FIG6_9ACTN